MTNKNTTMRHAATTTTAVCAVLLLAACTGHKKDATQSAARVDGTEITVHQINYRLQRERGLRADQQEEAGRKVLEQLIDEQLIVERAEKVKMDKEPAAQQALDAARREVLARAYVEQGAQTVAAPTDAMMHAYFDANDALFTHRRIYTLQEYLAEVPEDKIPALRALVDGGKSPADVEAWFKANGARFRGQQSTHPAEQIPLNSLKSLAAVQDGHGLVASAGNKVHVTYVASSSQAPVTFDKAKPAIGQFLTVEARRKVTEANLAALRTSAKIDYAAPYQALAASGPALGTTKDIDATAQIPAANGEHVTLPAANTSSGVQVTLPTTTTSGVQVSLPTTQNQGVRISLPATPASSVEVRLPPQAPSDAPKK
jgi:EpsD family peptidyl-prolyl cis-trans isomerase